MSEHHIALEWLRGSHAFDYETYPRDHRVRFDNGLSLCVSAAEGFFGNPDCIDPEETLAAALSSCHMLTFLALCSKKRLVVDSYEDNATATLDKNSEGKLAITHIQLRPVVRFHDEPPTQEMLDQLHARAHAGCFIANSIRSDVAIDARFA